MICPSCGAKIEDGHLYCEKCGMEIQMVPDFEPEIENSIIETLTTVAEEIEEDGLEAPKPGKEEPGEADRSRTAPKKAGFNFFEDMGQSRLILTIVTFLASMVAIVIVSVYFYHRYSVDYQISQARHYAQLAQYEKAIGYLEEAKSLKPDEADIVLLESNYYYQMGEKQKAVEQLLGFLRSADPETDDREKCYESMIAILNEEERYDEINQLLLDCEDNEVQSHFQQYMAFMPEFSYLAGSYDEVLLLRLSANTTGKIYYTLNGSNPDEHSLVYTAPLVLESGEYQIAALFVNEYGIQSEIARSWYQINLTVPDAPEVLLYSGSYQVPTMIEVVLPESGTVHYTMDGSNPTKDSPTYTEPVPMPLGRSNFKFITVSDEGVSSEIVSRSYDFALATDVTVSKAVENVIQALFDRKVLSDLQGHSHEIKGKYVFKYNTIVEIPNLGYYYVLDEYESNEGRETKTDRLYAVEVYSGTPNRLIYDENGEMGLISLK